MTSLQHSERDQIMTDSVRRDCLHCGTALTGSQEKFCCLGCAVVYEQVKDLSLLKYYDSMKNFGEHPDRKVNFDREKNFLSFDEPHVRKLFEMEPGHFVFQLPEIKCVGCLWLVENVLNKNSDVSRVEINLMEKNAHVFVSRPDVKVSDIANNLHSIGYDPHPRLGRQNQIAKKARVIDIGLSGLFFANVMMFSAALYFGESTGMNSTFKTIFPWMSAAIASLALALPGRSFLVNSWNSIVHRTLHIDLPITVALLVTYFVSLYNLTYGFEKTYFDSITGLIFLLICGRALDHFLQEKALSELRQAMPLLPEDALLCRAGQEIDCKAGDIIPADGRVISGSTEVNESALTGESRAVLKQPGSPVFAGTQNLLSTFRFRVEKSASESVVSRLAELIERARSRKSQSEVLLSKVLPWFLGFLTLVACIGFLTWLPHGIHTALEVFWTVLIVVCPCTLALSAPLSNALALSRLQKQGILVKSGDALERIANIDTILCDKTGTLTEGKPNLSSIKILSLRYSLHDFSDAVLRAADASRHPLSKAIAHDLMSRLSSAKAGTPDALGAVIHNPERASKISRRLLKIESVSERPGLGMEVIYSSETETFISRLGRIDWVSALSQDVASAIKKSTNSIAGHDEQISTVAFSDFNSTTLEIEALATFQLRDNLSDETRAAVERWNKSGLQVWIASGDTGPSTHATANELGITTERVHGGMSPEDKLELLNQLNGSGRKVMMIGDGLNDSACLSGAFVGVAAQGAVDLALSCSDVYLKRQGLKNIDKLIRFARHAQTNLKMALVLSASYNIMALYLALSHKLHPLAAALIMPATSISCFLLLALRRGDKIWKS